MAAISELGGLKPSEPIDLAEYAGQRASGTGFKPVPPPGRYTVRAPAEFPDSAFGPSKAGFLLAQIDPTVVGGEHDGYQIRFVKVSAKTFPRTVKENGIERKVTASQVADYLKACGMQDRVPESPTEVKNLVVRTAGQLYEIETDWKVWDKFNQVEYTLATNPDMFARDADTGAVMPFITVKDTDGNDKRLRANVEITRFIAAS